jgi:hypothetical protein
MLDGDLDRTVGRTEKTEYTVRASHRQSEQSRVKIRNDDDGGRLKMETAAHHRDSWTVS